MPFAHHTDFNLFPALRELSGTPQDALDIPACWRSKQLIPKPLYHTHSHAPAWECFVCKRRNFRYKAGVL